MGKSTEAYVGWPLEEELLVVVLSIVIEEPNESACGG
jgi:hypothetical protein